MKRGDVILSKDFQFANGEKADKLLVVLNEATVHSPYLLLLTTSQVWKRKTDPGCHAKDNYYVIPPKNDWFDRTTWVLYDNIVEYDFSRELKEHFQGKLKTMATLNEITVRTIINCLKQSDDVTPYQISLLEIAKKEALSEVKIERSGSN